MNPARFAFALRPLAALLLAASVASAFAAADPQASKFYEDALARFEKKDAKGAIVQLKNALKIDNKMLPAHLLLGRALMAESEFHTAEVAFGEAIKLGVDRAEVVVPMARAVLAQGRRQPVIDDPRFSLTGLPNSARLQMLLLIASAHADVGRPKEALKAIEDARAIDPANVSTWQAEVSLRIRQRQFTEAIAAADKALQLAPRSAEALYLRGSASHAQGVLPQALALYDQALAIDAEHLESLLARAGIAIDQNRPADAKRDIAAARKAQPKEPRAVYMSALLADREGDAKASRAALAELTALIDPVPVEYMRYQQQVLIMGGLAHYGLGEREKAKPFLEGVQREQPGNPVARLLAQILLAEASYDRAIAVLDAYVAQHRTDAQALSMLASAHLAQGRHARAAQIVQEALRVKDTPQLRTILGMSLLKSGRNADATAALEAAYAKDPQQLQAASALVSLYLADRKVKKAVEVAEGLVKRQPQMAGVHNLLGMALSQAGDTARARSAFEQALKLDAAFVDPQLNLARLDAAARQYDAAAARLAAVLKADNANIAALIESARLASQRNQTDESVRLLTRAADLSTGSGNLAAAFELFELHLRAGRLEPAREALGRLTTKAPEDAGVQMAAARLALTAKQLDTARTALAKASVSAGSNPDVLTQVALLQMGAGDAKGASASLARALQDSPDHLGAQALMVDADVRQRNLDAADKRARDIATRFPKLAVGHALQGDVAAARGQPGPALDFWRKAQQVEPSSAGALRVHRALVGKDPNGAVQVLNAWLKDHPKDLAVMRVQADTYTLMGNLPAARASYEALLKASPNNADLLNNYAHVLLAAKDNDGAAKAVAAAMAAKPDTPHIIGTAGWVAFKSGQTDRALQLLRDARLRNPANPDTRYFLAAALASTGRHSEAREELQAALTDGGNFANAKEARALMQTLK